MHANDRVRIEHMVEAAEVIAGFVSGRGRDDLESDTMLLFAIVRALEIIGEAASKVSEDARAAAPDVPWADIVGMRNRVVHAYWDVNRTIVWTAATEEVPGLLVTLRAVLRADASPTE